jgi:hypothetical protein
MLAGLDIEAKAELFERSLWASIPHGRPAFEAVEVALLRTDQCDPYSNEAAMAQLRITVKDHDQRRVGAAITAPITELALASYTGLFVGPSNTSKFGVYWPASFPSALVPTIVDIDGAVTLVGPASEPAVSGRRPRGGGSCRRSG